jgi:hypothetical protein
VIEAVGCGEAEGDGSTASGEVVGAGASTLALAIGVGSLLLTSCDPPVITSASDGSTCTAKIAKKIAAAIRLTTNDRRELMG